MRFTLGIKARSRRGPSVGARLQAAYEAVVAKRAGKQVGMLVCRFRPRDARRLATVYRYTATINLKPPMIIRLPSNGIVFPFIMSESRGSFITLALIRSR